MLDLGKEASQLFSMVEILRKSAFEILTESNKTLVQYAELADKIKDAKVQSDKVSAQSAACLMALRQMYERTGDASNQ